MTVRPPAGPTDHPSAPQAYQCQTTQSTGIETQMQLKILFGRKSHRKKQQQSRVFFDVFYGYSHVDNRERAGASD